jgi:hypothetical protein
MSGASAIASARRRRIDTVSQTTLPPSRQVSGTQQPKNNEDTVSKQTSTPLQILQTHDIKIKELEENLEETIVEISKKVFAENFKHFNLDKPQVEVKEFDSKPILEKIDKVTTQVDNLTPQVDNLTSRFDKVTSHFYKVTTQFDELKTLVIKSQQLNTESNIEMLKIKNKVLSIEEIVLELGDKLKEIHENQSDLANQANQANQSNIFNMGGQGAAEMLLRSMMQSDFMENNDGEKLNIHDSENGNENDLTELGDVSEITLTESELDYIKSDVQSVLVEENIKSEDLQEEDKIVVSEDDDVEVNPNE